MGIKYFLTGAAAALVLPSLWANPQADQKLFRETIKNVDSGGSYLNYQNHRSVKQFLDQAPTLIATMLHSVIPYQESYEVCRILFKVINAQAMQATAISIAHPQADQTVIKSTVYLGDNFNSPGIHRLFGTDNALSCNFDKLPNDTRIYTTFTIRLGDMAKQLEEEMRNSTVPKIRELPAKLAASAGIDIARLAATFNGKVTLIVCGTNLRNGAALLYLPDANGSLTQLLKAQLPQPDANGVVYFRKLEIPEYPTFKPFIMYREGGVIFSTGNRAINSKGAFAKFKQLVPAKADSYFLCDLDETAINELKQALKGESEVLEFVKLLKPFTITGATFSDGKSISGICICNFNVGKALLELPGKLLDTVINITSMEKKKVK